MLVGAIRGGRSLECPRYEIRQLMVASGRPGETFGVNLFDAARGKPTPRMA